MNKVLQSERQTVSSMLHCIKTVENALSALRNDETLHLLKDKVQTSIKNLGLDPLDLTRHRRPPPRLSGKAPSYKPETVEEHFRKTYFLLLDTALCQLRERFDPEKSRGLSIAQELDNTLLKGTINDSLIKEFPELNKPSLSLQISMFHDKFPHAVFQVRVELR
jgi:hypothetical protein